MIEPGIDRTTKVMVAIEGAGQPLLGDGGQVFQQVSPDLRMVLNDYIIIGGGKLHIELPGKN
jgi:hypothetical protein